MNRKKRIMVVDDAPDTLEVAERILAGAGYQVVTVPGVAEAVRALDIFAPDVVITDFRMPRIGGMDLVKHIRANHRHMEVIMVTGYATIPGAVEAIRCGAVEYLAKPFTEEEILSAVQKAFERQHLRRPEDAKAVTGGLARYGLLGESAPMRRLFQAVTKAAESSATVLIQGESGTGKELVARAIHYQSRRATAPFVPVNCAGIPAGLIESELFGHRKGAFTGAVESRHGFFQAAEGGTIFLDEIGEMGAAMQAAMLRVLQDREIFMLGARASQKVDVRVVAASNRQLEKMVRQGDFREDLFFRINVLPIEVPPLRERDGDLILLVSHFARKFARELGKPVPEFSDRALQAFRHYPWPGNVRELENVVHRLVIMCERDVVDAPDLPQLMRYSVHTGGSSDATLAAVEAEHIRLILKRTGGNISRAAALLGIDRKTLRAKRGGR